MNLYQHIISHQEQKNFFVKAQGGSGKTTQLRFIESKLIERAKKGEKIVPIYIDVKNIDGERPNPIFNEIHTFCGISCDVDNVKDAFEKAQTDYFSRYHFFILIDALNEAISHKVKAKIIEDTNGLSNCSNCIVIVTSRVLEEGLNSSFQKLEIQPIDEKSVFNTIERKYLLSDHIQSEKVNQSLIKILQTPLFLLTYLNAFPNEKNYSRLYDPKTARKGQILDAYRNKIIEDSDPQSRRSIEYRNQIAFLIDYYLPSIAFKMLLSSKFSISDKEIKELRNILTADYYENFVDEDEIALIDDYLNDSFSIIIKHFALIEKHGERPNTVYSMHNIWRDYFASLHLVNVLNVATEYSDLENHIDENIKQFVGELYKNKNGLCECDFESKCKCDDENMSPIELFMQAKTLNENVVKNLISIMITARHYKITSRFHNLDLKNVRFDNCTLSYSSFDNSIIYADNFLSEGHAGYVYDVKVIDDDTVISSGKDGTVKLWNYKTGKLMKSVKIHSDYASSLALCHDKQSIISGGYDNTSVKLNVKTLLPVGSPFRGHTDRINCVAVSNNDKYVASASDDTDVIIFDNTKDTHSIITKITNHRSRVNCIAFTDDDRYIISGDADGALNVFDIERKQTIITHAIEQTTREIWSSRKKKLEAVIFPTGTQAQEIRSILVYGDLIITGNISGIIIFWRFSSDFKTLDTFTIMPHNDSVETLAVYRDILVSAGFEGNIHLYDIKHQSDYGLIQKAHGDWINSLSISPKGEIFTAGGDQCIKSYDIKSLNEVNQPLLGTKGWTNALTLNANLNYLFTGGDDSRLRVFNMEKKTLQFVPQEKHRARINAIAIDSNQQFVIVAGDDGTIKKFTASSLELVDETKNYNNNWVRSLAISPDATYIAVGRWSGNINLYDFKTLNLIDDFVIPVSTEGSVEALCFSSDSKNLYFARDDKKIGVLRKECNNRLNSVFCYNKSSVYPILEMIQTEHKDRIRSLLLTSDDKHLYSAGWDGMIYKYDISSSKIWISQKVKAHSARVDAICSLTSLKCIVTGSDDGTLSVFDEGLNIIKTIKTENLTCISSICPSKDEHYIYAAGESGIISIIDTKKFNIVDSITQLDINIFGVDFRKIRGENIDKGFYKILRENGAII